MIGLFIRPQTQRERNVVRFSAAISGEERCKDKITEFVMFCDCDWLPNILILSLSLRSLCDESQSCLLCSVFQSCSETITFCFKVSNFKPRISGVSISLSEKLLFPTLEEYEKLLFLEFVCSLDSIKPMPASYYICI